MSSIIYDTGYILEEMYKILEKYKLDKLKKHIYINWTNDPAYTRLACIEPKYISKRQYHSYFYGYKYVNNPNFFLFSIYRKNWLLLNMLGKRYVVIHETAHIIDLSNQFRNLDSDGIPFTQVHCGYFQQLMNDFGYLVSTQDINSPKYWLNKNFIPNISY